MRHGRLGDGERRFLRDAAYTLLMMIRSGPQSVLAALDGALGGIDGADTSAIIVALDRDAETAANPRARSARLRVVEKVA